MITCHDHTSRDHTSHDHTSHDHTSHDHTSRDHTMITSHMTTHHMTHLGIAVVLFCGSAPPCLSLQHSLKLVLPDGGAQRHKIRPVLEQLVEHTRLTRAHTHTHTHTETGQTVGLGSVSRCVSVTDLCLSEDVRADRSLLTQDSLCRVWRNVDL